MTSVAGLPAPQQNEGASASNQTACLNWLATLNSEHGSLYALYNRWQSAPHSQRPQAHELQDTSWRNKALLYTLVSLLIWLRYGRASLCFLQPCSDPHAFGYNLNSTWHW